MNFEELRHILEKEGVPSDWYAFARGNVSDCAYLVREGKLWEVYYVERGSLSLSRVFEVEEDAVDYFWSGLRSAVEWVRQGKPSPSFVTLTSKHRTSADQQPDDRIA